MADTRISFSMDGVTFSDPTAMEEFLQQGTEGGGIRLTKKTLDITDTADAFWASTNNAVYSGGVTTLTAASAGFTGYMRSASFSYAYEDEVEVDITIPNPVNNTATYLSLAKNAAPSTPTAFDLNTSVWDNYPGRPRGSFPIHKQVIQGPVGMGLWTAGDRVKYRLKRGADGSWMIEFDTAAGATYTMADSNRDADLTLYGDTGYISVYAYRGGAINTDWTIHSITHKGYSSSAEVATLVSTTQTGTYKRSTLEIVAALNGARLADSSTKVQVSDNVDGAGWSGYNTVAAFQALGDVVANTSYQIRLQITGDGTELIEVTSAVISATTPTAGTAPTQPEFTVVSGLTGSTVNWTYSASQAGRLLYRKPDETTWSVVTTGGATASGTISGLDPVLYEFEAVAQDGTCYSYPAGSEYASASDRYLRRVLDAVEARLRSTLTDAVIYVGDPQFTQHMPTKHILVRHDVEQDEWATDSAYEDFVIQVICRCQNAQSGDGGAMIRDLADLSEDVREALHNFVPTTDTIWATGRQEPPGRVYLNRAFWTQQMYEINIRHWREA